MVINCLYAYGNFALVTGETVLAAPTFLSRPLFIQGKGWSMDHRDQQKKDAIVAAVLVFVVKASIMSVAHGAVFHRREPITDVLGNVFELPLVAAGITVVINNRKLMGKHAAGWLLNAMPGLAFLFSVLISYNGIIAIKAQLG